MALDSKEREWVWAIHKEADVIIHSRIQALVSLEAILLASYFASISLGKPDKLGFIFAILMCIIGLSISSAFCFLQRRIINGIIDLKMILLKDDAYRLYYRDERPTYVFVSGVPYLFVVIWILVGMATAISPYIK